MAQQEQEQSYSKMLEPDLDALGRHCEHPYCHQLDFLPFKCQSCNKQFCLDHRTEDSHECSQKGAWARRKREKAGLSSISSSTSRRPNILSHEVKQCSDPSCKIILDTPTEPRGTFCDTCKREYCLKHRMKWDHSCDKLTPLGIGHSAKTPGLGEALGKLRAWGAAKKASTGKTASEPSSTQTSLRRFTSSLGKSKSSKAVATSLAEMNDLKKTAKGPSGVPDEKKIYLYVEAEAFHTSGEDRPGVVAKIPRMKVFLNKDWVVGRALDESAKLLQVQNRNNQTEDEKDRLRVFLIEKGRLLGFGEKLGDNLENGNTMVLLRGISPVAA